MKPRAAMIFAAGFGTRMGDLTEDCPKPMLSVAGRPMIDRTVALLRDAGIEKIVANTHYLAEKLEPHLKSIGVIPSYEDPILETGGGLRAAGKHLDGDAVITINPDVLWQGVNPVSILLETWRPDMTALLMLVPTKAGTNGDFSLEQGTIQRFGAYRYTGLQIIRANRLDEIDEEIFSLNRYWDHLMADTPLHGIVYTGSWTDIGTRDALERANREAGR